MFWFLHSNLNLRCIQMNKTELVKAVSTQAELTQKDAAKVVDALFETISNTLAKEEKIQLVGFGTFEVCERYSPKRS